VCDGEEQEDRRADDRGDEGYMANAGESGVTRSEAAVVVAQWEGCH
jgi:hypothetical protein